MTSTDLGAIKLLRDLYYINYLMLGGRHSRKRFEKVLDLFYRVVDKLISNDRFDNYWAYNWLCEEAHITHRDVNDYFVSINQLTPLGAQR